jgi:hypothetical protein
MTAPESRKAAGVVLRFAGGCFWTYVLVPRLAGRSASQAPPPRAETPEATRAGEAGA